MREQHEHCNIGNNKKRGGGNKCGICNRSLKKTIVKFEMKALRKKEETEEREEKEGME